MANRVLSFGNSNNENQALSNEVYIDIGTDSYNVTLQMPIKPNEDDYLALLIEEHGSAEGAYNYIVSEETKEFSDDSKEFLRLQYSTHLDYEKALRYWSMHGNWKIGRLVNVAAIKNSIHQIFTWTPGERILLPEFGSRLRKLLYEGITDFNQEQIIAEIRNSVSEWEPRVRIDDIVKLTTTDDAENNTVYLRVIYSIPSLTKEQFYYDYSTQTSR